MTGETDNLLSEADNAAPSESDTPEDFDYYDPDEDNVEAEEPTGIDDETDEAESEVEAEAEDEDQEAEESDGSGDDEPAAALVTLHNGAQVTHDELIAGYMRTYDYTRKTQDVANQRKEVTANAERMANITDALVEHLSNLLPAEPDTQLALSDPGKYTAQKAQHDAAVAQLQKIIEIGEQPKAMTKEVTDAEHRASVAEENQKLALALPETGTKDGRQKFFQGIAEIAPEFGFSNEDLQQVTDHRVFVLAHWAKKGMDAEKAAKKAKAKAEKAPPVTPRKPGQSAKRATDEAAKRKFRKTGSLSDAMSVDYDF